ncbi:MAG: aldehyde dehydrogenase, partial [Proteobacteria bacterium]|nr:aldehyde dehydrogenase [Pseudomonadota bacterium]
MLKLKSYVSGKWHDGEGKTATLLNPATEQPLAETSTGGIDFSAALEYARTIGGPALRAMTFTERAEIRQGI